MHFAAIFRLLRWHPYFRHLQCSNAAGEWSRLQTWPRETGVRVPPGVTAGQSAERWRQIANGSVRSRDPSYEGSSRKVGEMWSRRKCRDKNEDRKTRVLTGPDKLIYFDLLQGMTACQSLCYSDVVKIWGTCLKYLLRIDKEKLNVILVSASY